MKEKIIEFIKILLVSLLLGGMLAGAILMSAVKAHAMPLDEPCGLTEEELAENLKHELVQYAGDFLEAEEKHGVNAAFLAAVASLESGHGRYCFRPNNIFGWSGKSFDSVPECIDFVAEKLARNYIDPNGKYYRGGTIADIGKVYCPGIKEWTPKVAGLFEQISQKPQMHHPKAYLHHNGIIYIKIE